MLLVVECRVSFGSLPGASAVAEAGIVALAMTFAHTLKQATEQYLSLQLGHRYFAPPASAHTIQSFADAALLIDCSGATGALCEAAEDATAVDADAEF